MSEKNIGHEVSDAARIAYLREWAKTWNNEDIGFLLAQIDARDSRIAKLESSIRELASAHGDQPMIAQPAPGVVDVTTVRDFCEEVLR